MKAKKGSGMFLGRISRELIAIAVALLGVGNAVADGELLKTLAQNCLEAIFDTANTQTTVEPVYDEGGNLTGHKVTLGQDYESLAFATDIGAVTLDLNGWTISGTNGVNGTATTAGGKGGAAIIVAGTCGADAGATAITVTNIPPVCVQLWENGPYFAQCNVGATKPEEYGYYFWWGDTVGYTNSGSAWVSADGNGTIIKFDENESPANSTYKKTVAELYDNGNGYIDANSAEGKLKPECDAATAHLGAPWRMMTDAELQKLVDTDIATRVCTSVWTTCNGVAGRRVFGITPGYEGKSIFFPWTGFGASSSRLSGSCSYWSSLPSGSTTAWALCPDSDDFSRDDYNRYFGFSVRPVRESAYIDGRPASGPAAAIAGGNGGDGNPMGKGSPAVVYESGDAVDVTDPMGLVKNGEDGVNRAAEWVLKEIFGEPSVVHAVVTNGIAAYTKVTLGQNYGPVALSNDLGVVTLDLNGWTISGTNGVNGTATTAGGKGGAAIIVAGTCGADVGTTAITVIDNGATDGVQLWENGPYFAECNVGANAPHESGYYFWWGDTVGYTNRGSAWVSVDGKGKTIQFSSSDTTANQTYGKDDDTLKSDGWIDEGGNLVAEHDAATAHLGAPWRMMTDAELETLVDEDVCQFTWTSNWVGTGKKGYVVKGKMAGYTDTSVFLPAAGSGVGSNLNDAEKYGFYWSFALYSSNSTLARNLWFDWEDFCGSIECRYYGCSVRPVRGFDAGRPAAGPSAAIIGGNGGDGNPAGKGAFAVADAEGAPYAGVTAPAGLVSNGVDGVTLLPDPEPPQPEGWSAFGTVKYPKPVKNTKYLKQKSTATWKAKAGAGCVFTGWTSLDGAKIPAAYGLLSENELKSPTLKLKIDKDETDILTNFVAATWAWIDEDRIGAVALTPSNLVVESKSYVTATVSGLPKGFKFDKKTLKIVRSGTKTPADTTAPKKVKVSVKNGSGYTFKQVYLVSVVDGVMTEPVPVEDKFNGRTGEPVVLKGDALLGKVTGSKVYVAGKKASIKATPVKNCIFLGWYEDAAFANAATNLPKGYLMASQSVVVDTNVTLYARFVALEGWTVGTFDGIYYDERTNAAGTVTFTVSSKGKVSGKTLTDGKSYSFSAKALDDAVETDGGLVFVAHPTMKVGRETSDLELQICENASTGLGEASISYDEYADVPFALAVQNGWKLKPSALPAFPTGKAALPPLDVTNEVSDLTLKFASKGVVTAAGKVNGKKVSVKSQVLPFELASEEPLAYKAQTCVYVPKAGFCVVYDLLFEAEESGTKIKDIIIVPPED